MIQIPPSTLRLRFEPAPSICKTEATVLRIHPFSHTSHMVVWLTEDGRRLVTPVKGAARPKSPFRRRFLAGGALSLRGGPAFRCRLSRQSPRC